MYGRFGVHFKGLQVRFGLMLGRFRVESGLVSYELRSILWIVGPYEGWT